jgi:MFS family permease
MSVLTQAPAEPQTASGQFWRWVHVALAALAMVATLPGRTQGLGLFTEPITHSLSLDKESYGYLNLWATLLGGLFCLPCGWLIDRLGTRVILAGVTLALGVVVVLGSGVEGLWRFPLTLTWPWDADGTARVTIIFVVDLFVLLLLTRGLGQSALSVASLSLIGRSAGRRTGLSMGVYACLIALGFIAAFMVLRADITAHRGDLTYWRQPWAGIGVAVLLAGVVFALLVRNRYLDADASRRRQQPLPAGEASRTLGQALGSPAFWTVSISISFFGMISAGTSLFNESILQDLHFDQEVFLNVTILAIPAGLVTNLLGGWLATRLPLARLLAGAMAALGLALLAFPQITTEAQVYLYGIVVAAAGGVIAVCFYTAWRRGYGPAHLGQIQGAAQMITVLFSGLGPVVFGTAKERLGTYLPLFPWFAAACGILVVATWLAPLPEARSRSRA